MPQAARLRMGRVIHLRRILKEEHRLRAGGGRPRLPPVGRTQGGRGDVRRVEQAIGRFQVAPRLRLGGQTGVGVGGQRRAQADGPRGAAAVAQRSLRPLRAGPVVKVGEGRCVHNSQSMRQPQMWVTTRAQAMGSTSIAFSCSCPAEPRSATAAGRGKIYARCGKSRTRRRAFQFARLCRVPRRRATRGRDCDREAGQREARAYGGEVDERSTRQRGERAAHVTRARDDAVE